MLNGKFAAMRHKILNKRIAFFLFLFLAVQLFFYLDRRNLLPIPAYFAKTIEVIVFSLAVLLIVSVIVRLTGAKVYHAFEGEVDIEHRFFLSKMYGFFMYLTAGAIILWKIGVSAGNITLFLGLVTTGVAFAVRDVLMSIFAWLIVLTKKPFKLEDTVKIGDESGVVRRIGTFYITLQPNDDKQTFIKLPNKMLLEKGILNYNKGRQKYTARLILQKIPRDALTRIAKLKKSLAAISKDAIHVYIETETVNWVVIITVMGPALDPKLHNIIMTQGYAAFKDVIKIQK